MKTHTQQKIRPRLRSVILLGVEVQEHDGLLLPLFEGWLSEERTTPASERVALEKKKKWGKKKRGGGVY